MVKKTIALVLLLGSAFSSFGQSFNKLHRQFDESRILKTYYYGFALFDVEQDRIVFGKNEHNYFTPASNTKVFTLYESLTHLGDSLVGLEYIEQGDSLYFWGTGDPTFLYSKTKTEAVFDFLKNQEKTLVYVPQETQEPIYRAGWGVEDYDYYYQPEVTPFPIYGNVARFSVLGNAVEAQPSFFTQFVEWKNEEGRMSMNRDFRENKFIIKGSSSKKHNFTKPFVYSDSLFVALLSDTLNREVYISHIPKPFDVKAVYSSHTREVLREMMLPSDNFLAEHLQMNMAYKKYNGFFTRDFRAYMDSLYSTLLPDKIQLRDGSGLSSYNKITPASMVQLLKHIYEQDANENEILKLFPAGGLEGTLKGVYPLRNGQPFVWAKTGTIHAVHAQSGFMRTKSGKLYLYSFLNNNYLGSSIPVRNEMVKIMTFLHDNY